MKLLTWLTGPTLLATALAAEMPPSAQLQHRSVTLYQGGFGFVAERYELYLSERRQSVRFPEIPAVADLSTLVLSLPEGTVLRYSLQPGVGTGEAVLERLRGRSLRFISSDGQQILEGVLVGMLPPYAVLQTPAGVLLLPSPTHYRVLLSGDTVPVAATASLEAFLQMPRAGRASALVSYLVDGLGWQMQYHLQLPPQGATATLCGIALIENQTEALFDSVSISLIAGTVPRLQARAAWENAAVMARMAAQEAAPEAPPAQKLSGVYRYEFPTPLSLRPNQRLRLPLIPCATFRVERLYRVESAATERGSLPVVQLVRFPNTEEAGLGIPLPSGTVLALGNASERHDFLGQTVFPETPVGDTVTLRLGTAFDIRASQRLLEYRELGNNLVEETYQLELLNGGQEPATVELSFQLRWDQQNWRISTATHPYRRIDAQTIAFRLSLGARTQSVVRFTVQSQRPSR